MKLFNRQISIPPRTTSFFRLALLSLLILVLVTSVFQPQSDVSAAAVLTITPLTWNVIGLDSNNVNVGPSNFPVGVRVCNSGSDPATNLTATFVWAAGKDLYTGDPYINLRSDVLTGNSSSSLTFASLGTTCHDFYFEVSVKRDSNAYNKSRRYHINITADGGISLSTPRPREIFVEH